MRNFMIFTVLIAIIGGAVGFYIFNQYQSPHVYKSDTLFVQKGMGGQKISHEIARTSDENPYLVMGLMRLSVHSNIHAGEYDLSDNPSLKTLFDRLNTQMTIKRSVTIPEGLTVYQVINIIKANDKVVDNCPTYKDIDEGSLLPETYEFIRGETCQSLLTRMQTAMRETLDQLWIARRNQLPYKNKNDALVMASIIEKETGVASERARVAGVFVNRLNNGMPMQSDPTTIYALTDGTGELGRLLTRADWKIEHPYNTYFITALPPKPIANAGKESIKAALHPEQHEYYYFVASGNGGHNFGKTLDEHNNNIHNTKK